MAQKLEAIRGGGGSIKVGTTGTISALMSRELEYAKSAPPVPSTCTSTSASASDEASSSSVEGSFRNCREPENSRRRHHYSATPQIPMLKAYDASIDGTPVRKKPAKKGHGVVEIVDIKCGSIDKAWVNPIAHRLKKLSFSKLSEGNV